MSRSKTSSPSTIKKTPNITRDDNMSEFSARSYQTEIMEQAKSENLIVCLPTGSGKTYIAVMLIKELSFVIRQSLSNGGKRTIFLVKTSELARQHYTILQYHLDLKINVYSSSKSIKLDDINRWNQEFENYQVLIFTAQIFLDILNHNIFSLDKVNLLIFDECHHAVRNDLYSQLIKHHYDPCKSRPRILGLTASISGQKIAPEELKKCAKDLEKLYHARIETGSDQMEINKNSTLVQVKHSRCSPYKQSICQKNNKIENIFKKLQTLSNQIVDDLTKNKSENTLKNDDRAATNNSKLVELQFRTLDQLKSNLNDIIHFGYDLGLYGLYLGIISLKNNICLKQNRINNQNRQKLYENILRTLDDLLINDQIQSLAEEGKFRFSDKVHKTEEFIKNNNDGQSIIFVERIHTAAFLCRVLKEIFKDSITIKYLAGSKACLDQISCSSKYQRAIVEEFRQKHIDVLISTSIIEEGLDIVGCNLVIRFNKANNFSSYMQSKGRARARSKNALFVILQDEDTYEEFARNKEEYQNYEFIEKMLKQNFKINHNSDSSSSDSDDDDDDVLLKSYRTENGPKINGIRSIQLINQYCAILGNNIILSPRFHFDKSNNNKFKCTLTMPINCPITEDIISESKTKKLAKQACCLKMVEMLHKKGEFDQNCLPIRPTQSLTSGDGGDDDDNDEDDENEEKKKNVTKEIIDKQSSYLFHDYDSSSSASWYLYRINIEDNGELGFVVPKELIKLPKFSLYGRHDEMTIEVIYLKSVDLHSYKAQLESFCQYIFEEMFTDMTTRLESILKFDIENSTFKLLPCLLTKSNEIDYQRIARIRNRKNLLVQDVSELDDNELYYPFYFSKKEIFINISNNSLLKSTSDPWEYKKSQENIKTYADYFENKLVNAHIQRDRPMATMKSFRRPRINFLKDPPLKKNSNNLNVETFYFPIEVLRYVAFNQTDYEIISKLPSILVRISQLYYIEQLRKLLADNIQSYKLYDPQHMPIVSFSDCLKNLFSSVQTTILPLISLNYDLLNNSSLRQPCSDLIFQAITRHSTNENADMENLEILGDCFLKLAMSMSHYHQYPSENAGKLTMKKDKQVSNRNLYRLAKNNELLQYLYAESVTYEGKNANWIPPGYIVTDDEASKQYKTQSSKRKGFADMIEALIGAFLVSTDYMTTIKFMHWLGLNAVPIIEQNQIAKLPSILCIDQSDTMNDILRQIEEFFQHLAFDEIEKKIHYIFNDKAYLIAAFTHPSYYDNRLTQCYERLEFLGDAVLDFLLIRCIFVEYYEHVTPSHVTDIRQDLSNNGRLAYLLVNCDLHKKILYTSPDLFDQITFYLNNKDLFSNKPSNIDQWADATAPKILADVFEALVGAIFLDSGCSLATVWKIIEPLLREYIERTIAHRNLNPKRVFHEKNGKIIGYTENENGSFTCIAELPDKTRFYGDGKSKLISKYHACQKAINSF